MTTWTPKTQQSETWTANPERRVFSHTVFSTATHNGLKVFSTRGKPLIPSWSAQAEQAETWTPA